MEAAVERGAVLVSAISGGRSRSWRRCGVCSSLRMPAPGSRGRWHFRGAAPRTVAGHRHREHALPGAPPRDPADRILIATARLSRRGAGTCDARLVGYAKDGHVNGRRRASVSPLVAGASRRRSQRTARGCAARHRPLQVSVLARCPPSDRASASGRGRCQARAQRAVRPPASALLGRPSLQTARGCASPGTGPSPPSSQDLHPIISASGRSRCQAQARQLPSGLGSASCDALRRDRDRLHAPLDRRRSRRGPTGSRCCTRRWTRVSRSSTRPTPTASTPRKPATTNGCIARALAAWRGDRSGVRVATKGGLTRPEGRWEADGRARASDRGVRIEPDRPGRRTNRPLSVARRRIRACRSRRACARCTRCGAAG